jgi:uncharacterized protein YhdP
MGAGATRWINRSIQGGSASDGSFLFFGHTADFPFESGDGVFKVSTRISDGQLQYLENWPVASAINGALELDGLAMPGKQG